MLSEISIDNALRLYWPIIDVRTPKEFAQGHVPKAVNIPLFSDSERHEVGKIYNNQSQESAIEAGYKFVNPKLDSFINESRIIAPELKLIVYCWRGGLRSNSFAKHLSDNGFEDVKVIIGGYKSYRNFVFESLAKPVNIKLLGGYTGSGKTHILHELRNSGKQIIDLEALAHHKGSTFGGIGQGEQPSVEQFGNMLEFELSKLNLTEPVWVEDESHNIGRIEIPVQFFDQMQKSTIFFIDIPKEERAKHLVSEYANCDKQALADSVARISKRLGLQNSNYAIELIEKDEFYEVALITLHYYDKFYLKDINKRSSQKIIKIPLNEVNHFDNARIVEMRN